MFYENYQYGIIFIHNSFKIEDFGIGSIQRNLSEMIGDPIYLHNDCLNVNKSTGNVSKNLNEPDGVDREQQSAFNDVNNRYISSRYYLNNYTNDYLF